MISSHSTGNTKVVCDIEEKTAAAFVVLKVDALRKVINLEKPFNTIPHLKKSNIEFTLHVKVGKTTKTSESANSMPNNSSYSRITIMSMYRVNPEHSLGDAVIRLKLYYSYQGTGT